jgi:hypothetical protein
MARSSENITFFIIFILLSAKIRQISNICATFAELSVYITEKNGF